MKLDQNKAKISTDDLEITRQAKKQVEYAKIGDYVKKIDGGKIFKISKEDGSVAEALYRTNETYSWYENDAPKQIDIEKGYWYVEALNAANAQKKVKQGKIILST